MMSALGIVHSLNPYPQRIIDRGRPGQAAGELERRKAMSGSYLQVFLAVLVYMSVWFLLALWRRRNDLADIAWGGGFIVAALASALWQAGGGPRGRLVVILVILWGLRLAVHIGLRNLGKGEDERYRKWREEWGRHWLLRSYLQVFLLQGFFPYLISLPVMWIVFSGPSPWT